MKRRSSSDVLRYSCQTKKTSNSTVRRHYDWWRKAQGTPPRCDMPGCPFEKAPLVWKGRKLSLILDHINGVNTDNRCKNLRLICPNCDAQLHTRGGRNKGKVGKAPGGFWTKHDGVRRYTLPAESGHYAFSGSAASVLLKRLVTSGSAPFAFGGTTVAVTEHRPVDGKDEKSKSGVKAWE